jgi:hypothetical protein
VNVVMSASSKKTLYGDSNCRETVTGQWLVTNWLSVRSLCLLCTGDES